MGEASYENLIHIVPHHTGTECQNGVDNHQLALAEHITGGKFLEEEVDEEKEEESENDIEEKGHCGGMTSVGYHLHIGDPPGIERH
jgi:hypothetical protein